MTWDLGAPGVVRLPSGRLVRGRSLRTAVEEPPDLGLYLLRRQPDPVRRG